MVSARPIRNAPREFPSAARKDLSIASVTVVYNGADVLRQHLQSLKRQTRKPNEIVIVDNASVDGTGRLLANEYPETTVLTLPQNSGVGGGLSAGLDYAALQKKHDWVWIFDQDSVPEPDGLERLIEGLAHLDDRENKTAVLAPVCVHPETGMIFHGLAWRGARLIPTAGDPNRHITLLDSVNSSGSLMRREALETAGLPRADFFMDFVDHEHCLRLRRYGFEIAVVRDSRLQHSQGEPSKFNFLGRTKYWSDHVPWREYYMTRNEIFTMWKYYPRLAVKGLLLYRLARHAAGILLFGKRKLDCIRMMRRGIADGRAGRLGIHRNINGGTKQPKGAQVELALRRTD